MFLWDVSTGQKIRRFRGHDSAVNAVSFAADDQVVITAGYDRAVKIWDARSNSIDPIQSVVAWRDAVTSLTVAGHCITGGSVDGTLRTLDVRAGRMHVDDLGRGRAGPGRAGGRRLITRITACPHVYGHGFASLNIIYRIFLHLRRCLAFFHKSRLHIHAIFITNRV